MLLLSTSTFLLCYLSFTNAFKAPITTESVSARATHTGLKNGMSTLEELGPKLNPIVGFFDPLNLAGAGFWGQSDDATIGFLRHAEIKHGRVAMAAFVGYIVQSNFVFPWKLTMAGDNMPSADLSPPEQWDALPTGAKLQIMGFVGFLEVWSELSKEEGVGGGQTHYMRGGIPGKFPSFEGVPHWVPFESLYDPFRFSKNMSQGDKDRRLLAEINNGRLAMIGIMGFLAEQTTTGAVPALKGVVPHYDGNIMEPLAGSHLYGF